MGSIFSISCPESDYERKRKYKMLESIRDSANMVHNFFDAMEEKEEFGDLKTKEEVSNG